MGAPCAGDGDTHSLDAPDEKANGRAILFSPNLEGLVAHRFPELKVISVENIFEGH